MTPNRRWSRVFMVAAITYPIIGIGFAALGNRPAWRLGAWLMSAVVFLAHVGYEHFRVGSPASRAALHTAGAVALGGFLLAVWILVHGHFMAPAHQSPFAPLALIVFPVVTGVPAFVVGFLISLALGAIRKPV